MRFSMMAVDANSMFNACKQFIVMNMGIVVKMHEMGCSDDCIHEAFAIIFNHVSNLYVCGMIDEEFFRSILVLIIDDEAIDGVIETVNDVRKDVVRLKDGQKI